MHISFDDVVFFCIATVFFGIRWLFSSNSPRMIIVRLVLFWAWMAVVAGCTAYVSFRIWRNGYGWDALLALGFGVLVGLFSIVAVLPLVMGAEKPLPMRRGDD